MLLNDGVRNHPKVLRAGGEASWLWAAAIDYCRDQLTDGYLPQIALQTLGHFQTKVERLAGRCVEAGLFERVEGGWKVHDFLQHNDSREDVQRKRDEASRRRARYRHAHTTGTSTNETRAHVSRDCLTVTSASSDAPVTSDTRVLARAYPQVGVGVGTDVGTGSTEGVQGKPHPEDLWARWGTCAAGAGAKQPLVAGPAAYEHLRVLAESYTADELERAMVAWWASPHTGGRNIGLFRSQAGEVLEWLAKHPPDVLFRTPLRVVPVEPKDKAFTLEDAERQLAAMAARKAIP